MYEGYWVKVKVTGAKKVENPYSHNPYSLQSAVTPIVTKFACTVGFLAIVSASLPSVRQHLIMVIVWRLRGNIVGAALCWVV